MTTDPHGYHAKYRAKHREAINARNRERSKRPDIVEYNRNRRIERTTTHTNILVERLGGQCVKCGTTENLEFDHIYPNDKEFNISSHISCKIDKLIDEADKCQLLCEECHNQHTIKQRTLSWQLFTNLPPDLMNGIMNGDINPSDIHYVHHRTNRVLSS